MLNAEKYKEELKENGEFFAVSKNGKLSHCSAQLCDKCIFCNGEDCRTNEFNWLFEEYKESAEFKLTKFEYLFLKNIKSDFKYITSNDNDLFVGTELRFGLVDNAVVLYFNSVLKEMVFQFIIPEKPYKIAEILNNCEVIDDE